MLKGKLLKLFQRAVGTSAIGNVYTNDSRVCLIQTGKYTLFNV